MKNETPKKQKLIGKSVDRTKGAMDSRMQQSVVLTFDDGSYATFTGPAVLASSEKLRLVDALFTEPATLEYNYCWKYAPSQEVGG